MTNIHFVIDSGKSKEYTAHMESRLYCLDGLGARLPKYDLFIMDNSGDKHKFHDRFCHVQGVCNTHGE